jgi:ribosome maturation factor RimP
VKVTIPDETLTGRITSSTDTEVTLDVDGTARTLILAEVSKALVQVEFKGADA